MGTGHLWNDTDRSKTEVLGEKNCINTRHTSRPLVPVAARSKAWIACWDCGFECSWVTWMSVSCEFCVLSGRGLCDGLITHLEDSYGVWCD
jgi:hypothetical protein